MHLSNLISCPSRNRLPIVFALAAFLAAGGAVTKVAQGQEIPREQRRAIIQSLPDDQRQKFFAMSAEEKQQFFKDRAAKKQAGTGGGGKPGTGGRQRGGRPPTLVELGEVKSLPLIQIFPITGRVVANQKSAVASRIKGGVSKVEVQIGDYVTKGQVLAVLDIDRLKLEADLKSADVHQARAKWKSATAQVDLLNLEMKRLERLRKSAAFSQARYDDKRQGIVKAKAAVDETTAALRRARASRDLARIDLKDATIRAPFAGVVLQRHISPGAFVNAGSPIVTLLDVEHLEIEADVPSTRLSGLKPNSIVKIDLGDKKIISAIVRAIIPDENPLSRTRAVRLTPELTKGDKQLIANQSVVVQVPQGGSRTVIAVPKDAIVNRQSGNLVFVYEKGKVKPIPVEIGAAFAGNFEIKTGLRVGQKVVVKGNERLRPGQRVRVKGGRKGGFAGRPGGGRGGPGGGPGGMSREQRRAIIMSLPDEERDKFRAMSREDKRKFFKARAQESKS